MPTAIRVASLRLLHALLTAVDGLVAAFETKAAEWAEVRKAGRTHLHDATPMTLGQEFAAYAANVRRATDRVRATEASLGEVPQDKKYAGEPTRLEIGDRNTIREFCTFNLGTAQDVGLTLEDLQDILVAVAPIVGSARVVAAAGNITRALGLAIAIAEDALEAELDDEDG